MRRFERILFVADERTTTTGALARAVERARRNEARLTLVRALRFPWSGKDADVISDLEEKLEKDSVTDWSRRLERLAAPIARQGVAIDTVVLTGRPFLEITRHVLRHGHDLVALEAEKASLSAMFFDPLSMHLIRKCPCPIWVLKPGRPKRCHRVMAAVDSNPYEPLRVVSRTILELAASQARLDEAELHVVHAWDVTLSQLLRRPSGMSDRRRAAYTRRIREAHGNSLQELMQQVDLAGLPVKVHLRKGSAGQVIPRLVKRERIEHLVMGSVRRVGIPGLLIGSTAERVLQRIRCSVLAVKPEGFVSPVATD